MARAKKKTLVSGIYKARPGKSASVVIPKEDDQPPKKPQASSNDAKQSQRKKSQTQPNDQQKSQADDNHEQSNSNTNDTAPPKESSAGKDQPPKDKKDKDSTSDEPVLEKEVAGYKVKDILKAPLEPPEVDAEELKKTSHEVKRFLVVIGAAIGLLGLIVFIYISANLGLSLGITGAIAIAVGVFWDPPKQAGSKNT